MVVKGPVRVLGWVVVINLDYVFRELGRGLCYGAIEDVVSPGAIPVDNNCRA
jgi:hypothetical protein